MSALKAANPNQFGQLGLLQFEVLKGLLPLALVGVSRIGFVLAQLRHQFADVLLQAFDSIVHDFVVFSGAGTVATAGAWSST